jgi:hypothetical protein
MTTFEFSIGSGFRMGQPSAVWDERLSELADYREIHGLQCSSNWQKNQAV